MGVPEPEMGRRLHWPHQHARDPGPRPLGWQERRQDQR